MESHLEIRRALPCDAKALSAIVSEAQRYWGYPQEWIELFTSDLSISEENISNREIYLAEESAQLLGFYVRAGNKLEELWIAPSHFGTGAGKELFLHAKNHCSTQYSSLLSVTQEPNVREN
jgi:hypothetical protein